MVERRQPIDWREWLEDMRRFHSRDADRATEILRILDDLVVERDEAAKTAGMLEAESSALRSLAVSAGLITGEDRTTDVVPLLRMFLPVSDFD